MDSVVVILAIWYSPRPPSAENPLPSRLMLATIMLKTPTAVSTPGRGAGPPGG